jgi:apolipoprotein N-acyltransferase
MRAIEEGLPIVRSANTGISAVIDPVGRIIGHLDLGSEGVLDSGLPAAISPTLYSQVQDIPAAIVIALSAIMVIRRRAKQSA